MKNIIFVISTLQEADCFFAFAAGLINKNKKLNIITIIDNPEFSEQLKRNKSLFRGFKKIGFLFCRKKKNKILQKIYSLSWLLKLVLFLIKLDKPILLAGGNFNNIYRIFFQFFCLRKKGKIIILNPLSFIWDYQYDRFRKEKATEKLFEKNFWHKILNLGPKGFIYYTNKQLGFVKLQQKNLKFTSKQVCCSGLGSNTKYYRNFFNEESEKYKKKISFLKKSKKNKKIYTIICCIYGKRYLLKKYSQEIILESIIDKILKCNKNSIILLRRHPKDIDDKRSHVLKVFSKLKLKKKNVFFTNLHPQILSRISSRVLCYARTNVMTDVFESKMIDCSEYKKVDLNRNNGQSPGNYGYGVIYVNPRKKNFKKKFNQVLVNDKFFSKKEVFKEEKKLIKENKFDYEKIKEFIKKN